jgi:hypothetical protein
MTVCIAAIGKHGEEGDPIVFGAADRMITMHDVEYEPRITGTEDNCKIWYPSPYFVFLMAGDLGVQMEMKYAIKAVMGKNKKDYMLREIVEWYIECHDKLKKSRGSALPVFETIITGIDDDGAHIYRVGNEFINPVTCCDAQGFAAIGLGSGHAQLEFMADQHNPSVNYSTVMLTTHSAKKRAEIAPGVGKQTDMFAILPWCRVNYSRDLVNALDKMYEKRTKTAALALITDKADLAGRFENALIFARSTAPQPPSVQSPDAGS